MNLMYVGAAISAIGAIVLVIVVAVAGASLGIKIATPGAGVIAVVASVVGVLGLIEVGLWLWMAWAVKRGMGWARIVSTVLFGVNAVLTLANLGRTGGGLVPGIVTLVIGLVVVIQLWRAESSAFFAAHGTR